MQWRHRILQSDGTQDAVLRAWYQRLGKVTWRQLFGENEENHEKLVRDILCLDQELTLTYPA